MAAKKLRTEHLQIAKFLENYLQLSLPKSLESKTSDSGRILN